MSNEILIALAAGLPSIALGFLGYRRSLRTDAVAAQAGVSGEARAGTAQIIEGQNDLIANLQADNQNLRADNQEKNERIDLLSARALEQQAVTGPILLEASQVLTEALTALKQSRRNGS